jgi:ATP-binding cassette subfamily F protein uup
VEEYVGGYEDWLRQRKPPEEASAIEQATAERAGPSVAGRLAALPAEVPEERRGAKRLSYRERREFEELPARIEALEAEQRALGGTIADPEFYKEPAAAIAAALERSERIERELGGLYARWDVLDSRPA